MAQIMRRLAVTWLEEENVLVVANMAMAIGSRPVKAAQDKRSESCVLVRTQAAVTKAGYDVRQRKARRVLKPATKAYTKKRSRPCAETSVVNWLCSHMSIKQVLRQDSSRCCAVRSGDSTEKQRRCFYDRDLT